MHTGGDHRGGNDDAKSGERGNDDEAAAQLAPRDIQRGSFESFNAGGTPAIASAVPVARRPTAYGIRKRRAIIATTAAMTMISPMSVKLFSIGASRVRGEARGTGSRHRWGGSVRSEHVFCDAAV
jgi:hypothetical protein